MIRKLFKIDGRAKVNPSFFSRKAKIFFSNLFVNVLICEVFVISQYFPYKHFADFDNELAQIVLSVELVLT